MSTDGWGIVDGYHDVSGGWHETDAAVRGRFRAAMGGDPDAEAPPAERPVWFVRAGNAAVLQSVCNVQLEDGTDLGSISSLPPDLPIGYHDLVPDDGGPTTRLIVTPGRCHLPDVRGWLWAVQLYAARSSRSWGNGDLGDLATIASHARQQGAWGVVINPLHAPLPIDAQQPSPYYPSSRRWLSPLYICIENVPGAAGDPEIRALAARGTALLADRIIDRDRVWELKRAALDAIWTRTRETIERDATFTRWRRNSPASLEPYARFAALAERFGTGWDQWPAEMRHPDSPAVSRFARENAEAVAFHAWIQWLLEQQLAAVDPGCTVVHDLAVGVDPTGADAWIDQDVMALDVSVGAPPDEFATAGQDWGLPPFVPWKLRERAYEPYVDLLRRTLRPGSGLRIDHVMGLFRLFWIPRDGDPAEGTYVRFPAHELLELVTLESVRAGTLVIGEDLGTVEPEVREALHAAAVLSYRLAWFEEGPPATYPEQALAAVTTHDLPTIAGAWTGDDAAELRRLGRDEDANAVEGLRVVARQLANLPDDAPLDEVIVRVHERLVEAPSMLVAATLDDALAARERPNLPGTTDERPNWSIGLPRLLDDAFDNSLLKSVVTVLDRKSSRSTT